MSGLMAGDPARSPQVTILTTCQEHGARGFCNLRVRKDGGDIVLDPHVSGQCVLTLNEAAATALHRVLGEWLR